VNLAPRPSQPTGGGQVFSPAGAFLARQKTRLLPFSASLRSFQDGGLAPGRGWSIPTLQRRGGGKPTLRKGVSNMTQETNTTTTNNNDETNTNRKPNFNVRLGKMSLSVWREADKENNPYYKYTLQKGYLSQSGSEEDGKKYEWTNYFTDADLFHIKTLVDELLESRSQVKRTKKLNEFFSDFA
jgi:hypothetical protein